RAIVSAIPGTTRDLNIAPTSHDGREFLLIDSGGLELGGGERLTERVVNEALGAIARADVVVLMLDGRAGLNPADREVLDLVREVGHPTVVAVNKLDQASLDSQAAEFYALGFERLFCISSAHGRGVEEMLDVIVAML